MNSNAKIDDVIPILKDQDTDKDFSDYVTRQRNELRRVFDEANSQADRDKVKAKAKFNAANNDKVNAKAKFNAASNDKVNAKAEFDVASNDKKKAKLEFDLGNEQLDKEIKAFKANNTESGKAVTQSVPDDPKPTPPSGSGSLSACKFDFLDVKPKAKKSSGFIQQKIFKYFTPKSKSERYRKN